MKKRLHIFIILSLFISPFAIYGADAFLFMGTGNSGNPANLSDRSQWTYLSTYDSGGDDWNFRVFLLEPTTEYLLTREITQAVR